jgi:hypothetical protein
MTIGDTLVANGVFDYIWESPYQEAIYDDPVWTWAPLQSTIGTTLWGR